MDSLNPIYKNFVNAVTQKRMLFSVLQFYYRQIMDWLKNLNLPLFRLQKALEPIRIYVIKFYRYCILKEGLSHLNQMSVGDD